MVLSFLVIIASYGALRRVVAAGYIGLAFGLWYFATGVCGGGALLVSNMNTIVGIAAAASLLL